MDSKFIKVASALSSRIIWRQAILGSIYLSFLFLKYIIEFAILIQGEGQLTKFPFMHWIRRQNVMLFASLTFYW